MQSHFTPTSYSPKSNPDVNISEHQNNAQILARTLSSTFVFATFISRLPPSTRISQYFYPWTLLLWTRSVRWHIINRVNCPGLPALWLSDSTGLMAVRQYRPYGRPGLLALWLSGSTGIMAVRGYRPYGCPTVPALWLSRATGLMAVRQYRPYGCPAVPTLWLPGSTGLTAVRGYRPYDCPAIPTLWLSGSTGLTAVRQYQSRKHYKSYMPKPKEHLIHFKKHYTFSCVCNQLRKYWV